MTDPAVPKTKWRGTWCGPGHLRGWGLRVDVAWRGHSGRAPNQAKRAFPSFLLDRTLRRPTITRMGFNRHKMEDQRRQLAEKEVHGQARDDARVLEGAERLIAA